MGNEINIVGNNLSGEGGITEKSEIEGNNTKINICNNKVDGKTTISHEGKIKESSIEEKKSSNEKEKENMGKEIGKNVAIEPATGVICKAGELIFKKIFKP